MARHRHEVGPSRFRVARRLPIVDPAPPQGTAMSLNLSSSRPLRSLVLALALVAPLAAHAADAPQLQLAPSATDDPVVAKINGTEVHKSDLLAAQKQLPPRYQQV